MRLTAREGDILYTMDGSDPRLPGGAVNPSARNYNSVSLVSSISPAKWLVPRGDAAEAGWQDLAYDDSGWSDGWGVLGFETGITDDPLEMTAVCSAFAKSAPRSNC